MPPLSKEINQESNCLNLFKLPHLQDGGLEKLSTHRTDGVFLSEMRIIYEGH